MHKYWMKWKAPTGRWWRQWRQRSAAALVSAGTTSISVSHALQTTTGLGGNNISGVGGSERQTLRKERSDSHIFIFCTFFSLKCGISDFLALRAEVRWLKNLANNSLWGGENTIMQSAPTRHSSSLKRQPAGGSASPRCLLIVPQNRH